MQRDSLTARLVWSEMNREIQRSAASTTEILAGTHRGAEEGHQPESEDDPSTIDELRKLIESLRQQPLKSDSPAPAPLAAAAFLNGFGGVMKETERRIRVGFWSNVSIIVAMTAILLIGIAGAVGSVLIYGMNIWSVILGGLSLADVLAFLTVKPHYMLNVALIASTKLGTVQLKYAHAFNLCNEYKSIKSRFACNEKIYKEFSDELDAILRDN
jgi:hypothetical protein